MQVVVGEAHRYEAVMRCRFVRVVEPLAEETPRVLAAERFDADAYDAAVDMGHLDGFLHGLAHRVMADAKRKGFEIVVGTDDLQRAIDAQYEAEKRGHRHLL